MRSFQITPATDFQTIASRWVDNLELTCRHCETAFVPSVNIKVGQALHCPSCGEQSTVPKKARWQ